MYVEREMRKCINWEVKALQRALGGLAPVWAYGNTFHTVCAFSRPQVGGFYIGSCLAWE
jgi:hypothetical protein